MAKDARGHGSNGRGGSVPDQHRAKIAASNRKNPLMGYFLGGDMRPQDTAEAKRQLAGPLPAKVPGSSHNEANTWLGQKSPEDKAAADVLHSGSPKSITPPVHE